MGIIKFSNGVIVKEEMLNKAAESALSTIEKELPLEALSYEIYQYVINICTDRLKQKKIVL